MGQPPCGATCEPSVVAILRKLSCVDAAIDSQAAGQQYFCSFIGKTATMYAKLQIARLKVMATKACSQAQIRPPFGNVGAVLGVDNPTDTELHVRSHDDGASSTLQMAAANLSVLAPK